MLRHPTRTFPGSSPSNVRRRVGLGPVSPPFLFFRRRTSFTPTLRSSPKMSSSESIRRSQEEITPFLCCIAPWGVTVTAHPQRVFSPWRRSDASLDATSTNTTLSPRRVTLVTPPTFPSRKRKRRTKATFCSRSSPSSALTTRSLGHDDIGPPSCCPSPTSIPPSVSEHSSKSLLSLLDSSKMESSAGRLLCLGMISICVLSSFHPQSSPPTMESNKGRSSCGGLSPSH